MKLVETLMLAVFAAGAYGAGPAAAADNLCVQLAHTIDTEPQPLELADSTAHVYKSVRGVDLRLHVFRAAAAKGGPGTPAIIFFFGGAWMVGSVTEMAAPAAYFAGRGATSILVDYRVFCRNGVNIVDEVADAKSAVRWVRGHARELGIDPARIVASGGSSGGHLALSTAMFGELDEKTEDRSISSKPNLLVLFYPCVDETTPEEVSYGGDAIGGHGREVSPLYHVAKGLPAIMIFQGTADSLYAENKQYCAADRAAGNACELVEYAGAPHGFFASGGENDNWYEESLRAMDSYLTRLGYLPHQH
jgi:acetyl esterase/lipase